MFCANCGQQNADVAQFCQQCGARLATSVGGAAPHYAGFWQRFAALIIDAILIGVATGILGIATHGIGLLLAWGLPWVYEALMLSSDRQATLGKIALGIRVTGLQSQRLTFGRATGRHFAKYISALLLGIGFIIAAFTERKQALHDMIAETLVVTS